MVFFSKKKENVVTDNEDIFGIKVVIDEFKILFEQIKFYQNEPDKMTVDIALNWIKQFEELKVKFEKVLLSIDYSQGITDKRKNNLKKLLEKPLLDLDNTYSRMIKYKEDLLEYNKIEEKKSKNKKK